MASAAQIKLAGVRRLSAREAWLAACLGLLAVGAVAYYAQGWAQGQRDRFATAQADLAAARASRVAAVRLGAARPAPAQLGEVDAWSTHGRSFWLARLQIEQRLEAAAAAARLPSPEIRLAEAPEAGGALMLVKAEVVGPYMQGPWLAFMRALAAPGPAFVVDKLDVSDADTAQFSLSLLFPVKLDAPAPGPLPGPAPAEAAP
ncbi:MAG TPA: hypothetical protein VGG29_13625 [Caulobacteraceae bacterium]|jgi:hypothetical protein